MKTMTDRPSQSNNSQDFALDRGVDWLIDL